MAYTELVILITQLRDAARDALRELRRLDAEGWVDLTCYARVDANEKGELEIREASDCAEAVGRASGKGLAGAVSECLGNIPGGALPPGHSALVVMVEQLHADRVAAEFESRGLTVRNPLPHGQCEVVLRASIDGIQGKINWLAELLEHEAEKLERAHGAERERLELGIRAGRTELAAARVHLQARLLALRAELEARLLETARNGKTAEGIDGSQEMEREIADINEDLALSILDHLDTLGAHADELRQKLATATADTAVPIEEQLDELDMHMRKYRSDLTATLAASASLSRRCMERLQVNTGLRKAGMEASLRDHMRKLEQRHALLKADIQQLQREDSRSWHDLTAGFRETWRNLRVSLQGAGPECQ